jgi:hypothetical protein
LATGNPAVKAKVADALRHSGLEVDESIIDKALVSGYNIATFSCKASPYTVDVIFSQKNDWGVDLLPYIVCYDNQ